VASVTARETKFDRRLGSTQRDLCSEVITAALIDAALSVTLWIRGNSHRLGRLPSGSRVLTLCPRPNERSQAARNSPSRRVSHLSRICVPSSTGANTRLAASLSTVPTCGHTGVRNLNRSRPFHATDRAMNPCILGSRFQMDRVGRRCTISGNLAKLRRNFVARSCCGKIRTPPDRTERDYNAPDFELSRHSLRESNSPAVFLFARYSRSPRPRGRKASISKAPARFSDVAIKAV
jgi:hypothetical protein